MSKLAVALLAVWAVGVPLLYTFLLIYSRKHASGPLPVNRSLGQASGSGTEPVRIHSRRASTPLGKAISFLSDDYRPECYLWEPTEQLRKLVLTGVVLLIPEQYEQGRVLLALTVSLTFLILQVRSRPQWLMKTHYFPLATHLFPLTSHYSPNTTHHSPLATRHSPLATRHSSLTTVNSLTCYYNSFPPSHPPARGEALQESPRQLAHDNHTALPRHHLHVHSAH